ncbi:tyrosyl-tRNA synthetase [Tulasnella sp. 403]|nr:tyrosyl-tRNA synthetase [Tulasnella sp. 403]
MSCFRPSSRGTIPKCISIQRTRNVSSGHGLVSELKSRGLVAQLTSENLAAECEKPITLYSGVDPSARSLHIGNLLPLITLLHFQLRGHQPIALVGGATGSIGDPGGRSTERKLLALDEVQSNVQHITTQVHRFFENAVNYAEKRNLTLGVDVPPPKVVNNLDWYQDMPVLDFLRLVGKHAKVNTMISRDSVSSRLHSSQGISFTEFSYQLLQAHDFYTLHTHHGCRLQIGGSDQWGNIVAGIDLIHRRKNDLPADHITESPGTTTDAPTPPPPKNDQVFGLTIPLLTTPSGEKFGKSAGNAVWLNPSLTSVFDFYQYFIRVSDDMVRLLLPMFTFLPLQQVAEVITEHKVDPSQRVAQKVLAREVTELVHGCQAVRQAEAATTALFDCKDSKVRASDVVLALGNDPRLVFVKRDELVGTSLTKLMAQHGRAKSRSEVNQVVKTGGFYMNSSKILDPRRTLQGTDLIDSGLVILRMGVDNHLVLAVDDLRPTPPHNP